MKKDKQSLGGKILRGILIALLVLVLLVGILLLAAYGYYRSKIAMLQPDETVNYEDMTLNASQEQELNQEGQELSDELAGILEGLDDLDPITAKGDVVQDDHVLNILLIGTDERTKNFSTNARGDSCILLSINTAGDAPVISLVSFERGMGVPILDGQYAGQWDWLTHTFRYGGAELMMREIEECFKINVDHYVRVNFYSFTAGINAIGGVDVYLDQAELNYFTTNYGFSGKVGTNHLNGEMALNYARLRSIDSDWVRIQRQREVIASAFDQLKKMDLAQADALINELLTLVRTNLTEEVITELLFLLPSLPNATMQQATVPQSGTYGSMTGMGGRSLYAVDFQANAEFLREFLYGTGE